MSVNVGTLEGLIKLRDEFTSVIKRAASQLQASAKDIKKSGKEIEDVGRKLTQSVTLPIIAVGGAVIKLASDFESSFAGVVKTVDGLQDEFGNLTEEGKKLQQAFRDMSKEIPVNVNELNAVAEAAGQLGIAREDIVQFTRTMADLGNTTNLTAEEAATATAQFQNIFGAAGKDVDRFGSTLVALGNAGASTEKQIIDMGLRIAGAGNQIGLTQGEVLAFASSLASVGIEAEAGGSAISKVMISMALAVQNGGRELQNFQSVAESALPVGKDFATVFREDAATAVTAFIAGLQNIDTAGGSVLKTLDEMGITEIRMRDALLRAAGAGKLLTDSLDLQSKAWEENNALTEEAKKRYKTFASQVTILWNRIKDLAVELDILTIFKDLIDAVDPLIKILAALAKSFGELPKVVKIYILSTIAFIAAVGPAVYIIGNLITAFGSIVAIAPKVITALAGIRTALSTLGGPIAIVIGAFFTLNYFLAKHKQAQEEYQRALIRSAEITALSRKAHISNADALFQEAKANLRLLEAVLQRQKAELGDIQRVNPFAASDRFSGKEAEQFRSSRESRVREDLAKTEQALADLRQSYVKLEDERSKVGQSGLTDDFSKMLDKMVGDVNIVTEDMEELGDELGKLRRDLAVTATQNNKLADAFGKMLPKDVIDRIKRTSALHIAYLGDLDQFGKAAADSLRGLRAAEYDSNKAAEDGEESYNAINEALQETDRITRDLISSSGGLGESLKKSLDINTTKLNDSVDEMLKFIDAISQIDEELDFEVRLSALDDLSPHLQEIEINFLNLLRNLGEGSVAKGEEIFAEMANALGLTVDQIKAKLGELSNAQAALRFKGASLTSRDIFKAEKLEIERLVKAGALSVADGQAAINQSTQQFWSQQLSEWSNALGFLADKFGGLFSYLNDLVSSLQQAQGFVGSVQGIAGGFGASASTISALGWIAGTLAVFALIYEGVDKIIKKHKARRYGTQLTFDFGDFSQTMDDAGNSIVEALHDLISGIEEALNISIDDLAEIGIHVRNDGEAFKVFFKGVLVDTYGTLDEALEEALRLAITDSSAVLTGLSDLMQEGISSQRFSGFEDMMEFLAQLKEISDLGSSAGIIDLKAVTRNLDDLWDVLRRLRSVTQSVADGYSNLVMTELNTWRSLIDSVTGRQPTEAELLENRRRELVLIRTEIELRKAIIRQRILEIEATIAAIKAGNMLAGWPGGGGGNVGGGVGPSSGIIGVAKAFAIAGGIVAQTGAVILTAAAVLTQEAIDMIAALEAEADALRDLLAGLQDIVIPDPASLKPGRTERGSGGGDVGINLRELIDETFRNIDLSKMTEFQRQLAEINKKWDEATKSQGLHSNALERAKQRRDEAIKAAKGNEEAIKAANEAYERAVRNINATKKEIEEANEARKAEIALLEQQTKLALVDRFKDFLGLANGFDAVRKTAQELIKDIEGSPFGDARKAQMIGRILGELDRQIEQMSVESASSLFGQMLGDLEAFGASEELMSEARNHMAVLEHTLKMENYRAEIAILKAQGKLAPEIVAALEKSFTFLDSIDISVSPTGDPAYPFDVNIRFQGYDNVVDASDRFADALNKAKDLLKKYQTDGLDPLTRSLQTINADFEEIRKQLGNTPEVMIAYSQAIKAAYDQFLSSIRQTQEDLFFGELSPVDTMSQWQKALADFGEAQLKFRQGDLNIVGDVPEIVQRLLGLAREVIPIGSEAYKDIFIDANKFLNEILAMQPDDLGSAVNPMNVSGMADLKSIGEYQIDYLERILRSSDRVAEAVEMMDAREVARQNVFGQIA